MAGFACCAAPTPLPTALPAASAATSVGDVYRRVGPAVVELGVTGLGGRGSGSGVVVDPSGLIITNNHVVAQASRITVRFRDGTNRFAEVLCTDPANDLALLRVDLPPGTVVLWLAALDCALAPPRLYCQRQTYPSADAAHGAAGHLS